MAINYLLLTIAVATGVTLGNLASAWMKAQIGFVRRLTTYRPPPMVFKNEMPKLSRRAFYGLLEKLAKRQ